MASRTSNFCIDARDPYAQARWWSTVLEDFWIDESDEVMSPDDDECWLAGPDDRELIILRVPEPKTVKNRMHFCIRPVDRSREEEVDRILGLGASLVADRREGPDKGWAVLADLEATSSACSPLPQGRRTPRPGRPHERVRDGRVRTDRLVGPDP